MWWHGINYFTFMQYGFLVVYLAYPTRNLDSALNTHTPKSIQTRLKARVYTEKNQVTREIFHGISFQSIP